MASNLKNQNVRENHDDFEVKIVFDDDLETQQCTDLSSSLVNRDHFQQQINKSISHDPAKVQSITNNVSKTHFSHNRKLSDPSHKFSEEQDELQDGFSEILVDPKVLQRRQRFATKINLMAKSDVGFKVVNQDDDSNEINSNSSLGSSMINNSQSQIGSINTMSKTDKILINLELYKIKVFDVKEFQNGQECSVCKSKFGLFSLRIHHCRFCGLSCCQHCSGKRINSQRTCDLCFITIGAKTNSIQEKDQLSSFIESVDRQKKYQQLVEEQNNLLLNQYLKMQKYSEDLSTKEWTLQIQGRQLEQERKDKLDEYGKQLRDVLYDKTHQQQNIKNLKGIIESKQTHLEDKKKVLYQLEQQLKRQREDNLMKKQAFDNKKNKLNRLNEKKEELAQKYSINTNVMESVKGYSIVYPDQAINENHFSVQKSEISGRSLSYYDSVRNSSVFYNESKQPTYDQLQQEQINKLKSQRCYTLQSDQYSDFEPKTHNVAPKKDKKGNFCVNKCDFQ